MNTQEAISHLKRLGYSVTKEKGRYSVHRCGQNASFVAGDGTVFKSKTMTARELIKYANIYSSNNPQNTAIKKIVKKVDKKKNRSKVRNIIKSNNLDKIEEMGHTTKPVHGNKWNWD